MKKNFIKNKLKFTGISTPIVGVSWEYQDSLNEKREVLRELYSIRNKLVRFYFTYENDLEMNGDIQLEGDTLTKYYGLIINLYNEVGELLFNSKYFVLLPSMNRQQIINSFDYVIQQDEFLEADPGNNSIDGEEDVMPMITDLMKLFNQIENAINEINQSIDA